MIDLLIGQFGRRRLGDALQLTTHGAEAAFHVAGVDIQLSRLAVVALATFGIGNFGGALRLFFYDRRAIGRLSKFGFIAGTGDTVTAVFEGEKDTNRVAIFKPVSARRCGAREGVLALTAAHRTGWIDTAGDDTRPGELTCAVAVFNFSTYCRFALVRFRLFTFAYIRVKGRTSRAAVAMAVNLYITNLAIGVVVLALINSRATMYCYMSIIRTGNRIIMVACSLDS